MCKIVGDNMTKLSFCIPVFNQSEIVKKCIESIAIYPKKDIEIVISDDCSNEDIRGLVKAFGDDRIYYYRNDENLGHDLNIIAAFKHARGEFVFLLRTRDLIISESIPELINIINTRNEISYITGSAIDDKGNHIIDYKRTYYEKGIDALSAHLNLYIHPSGSAYNRKEMNFDELEGFIKKTIDTKFSFIVHNLLRMQLSQKGGFAIVTKPIWIYTNTSRCKDVAVNSAPNKESVYSPNYCKKRYLCEMLWCRTVIPPNMHMMVYEHLFKEYLKQCTWLFKLSNADKNMRYHYNYHKVKISVREEQSCFVCLTKKIQDQLVENENNIEFGKMIKKAEFYNKSVGAVKYCILSFCHFIKLNSFLNGVINKFRYIRRLK